MKSLRALCRGTSSGFGGGSGSGYISVGAITGYSLAISTQFNFEANIEIGYGNFTNRDTHVLHLVPTVGFRYAF